MTSNVEMECASNRLYTPVYDDFTTERIKREFSRLHDEHYLDHAGATLYSERQMKNVSNDMLSSVYGNPHTTGITGNTTHDIIERTRSRILDHFHASADEYDLVFTSGATSSLKIIAETFRFGDESTISNRKFGHFVYTQDNHTSVLGMRDLVAQRGAKVSCLSHEKAFDVFAEKFVKKKTSGSTSGPTSGADTNSLFVYSAQCNFSGLKYPLEWINEVHNGILDGGSYHNSGSWYVFLDAAGFVGTNDLDLSKFKPDFVCLSFYKMFGYPTGTGALLVRKSSSNVLEKIYYGGGTVNLALSMKNFHVKRDVFHERFEDGTLPFLSIISLQHGLDALSIVPMAKISSHVFSLARYLHHSLRKLHHSNSNPVAKIYSDTDYENVDNQGGTISFNLLRPNGEFVGYNEISHMASIFKIHFRTGCFCNPGACQRHLRLSEDDVMKNYDAGYTCGGSRDLINGKPTGAVRISFGYMSKVDDVDVVLLMIKKCFLHGPEVVKSPKISTDHRSKMAPNFVDSKSAISDNQVIDDIDKSMTNGVKSRKIDQTDLSIKNKDIPLDLKNEDGKLKLSRLFIYPIKSCAAFEIKDSWILSERGLLYDREWMIVTSAGICLSQKQHVKLCLLKPKILQEKNILMLDYPGMPSAQIPLERTSANVINGELCRSRVCGHKVEGIDCGSEISEWLSLALGRPNLRLIRQNSTETTKKDSSKPELSFSSQAQYLLITEASIKWIIDRLPEDSDCSRHTILNRFRGNMVIRGCTPFEETTWSRIQIGKHTFQIEGPCARCQMVCTDQTTGKKTVEPLRLIAEEFNGKMRFGVYLSRQKGETRMINIGDSINCI